MFRLLTLLVACFAVAAGGGAGAAETVREFRGSGNTITPVFTVDSPWLLDWRLDGPGWQNDRRTSKFSALEITLLEADSGRHIGRVKMTKNIGNGLRMFRQGGRYQLKISTTHARWLVKIEQLSREEAERYTPKEKSGLLYW